MEILKKLFGPDGTHETEHIEVVEQILATNRQHVLDKLKEVEDLGGEGLMLRKPGSYVPFLRALLVSQSTHGRLYEGHRSGTLLKIKVTPLSCCRTESFTVSDELDIL